MDHWKKNSSLRYFAGLALLMLLAGFAISASPAFARYRSGETKYLHFEVREPEHICFGSFVDDKFVPFTDSEDIKWEISGDTATLTLTVANGTSGTDSFPKNQKINILLAAGPEFSEKEVSLVFWEGEAERTIKGTAAEIEEDSTFDKSYGAGVLFSFMENETEFSYILEGGKFSYFTFMISVDTSGLDETSLLQPHVVAEVIQ